VNYCSHCGGPLRSIIPPGDDRQRFVCKSCHNIQYQNPKVVVGCIGRMGSRILLCKRAIDPQYGKWTLPAGYLENGETAAQGALRETMEEARAPIRNIAPYGLINVLAVNQIYLMFLGDLEGPMAPGPESLEVGLFSQERIPWEKIAFTSITLSIRQFYRDLPNGRFPFFSTDIPPRTTGHIEIATG
jgi:ADP-ribose pyrophosphatase YjhB (NUDIX family)